MVAHIVKNLPALREIQIWSLDWEDSPGEGNGNPLQHSCLETPNLDKNETDATDLSKVIPSF